MARPGREPTFPFNLRESMRILFCNDSFPGNFEALAGLMAADPADEVLFLSTFVRKDFSIPGVSRVRLRLNREKSSQEKDAFFPAWERAYRVGRQTFQTLQHLRESGFIPDMILVSSADGPGLFLRHAFPNAFIVSYLDRYKRLPQSMEERERLAASISLQSYQMGQSNLYFVLSEWQRKLFSPLLRSVVRAMPCFVDTDLFSPSEQAEEGLSVLWRDHPGGGLLSFNIVSRRDNACERLLPVIVGVLAERPQCLIALNFRYEEVRHHWEQRAAALPAAVRNRLFCMKFSSFQEYRKFLCSTSVHVFFDVTETPTPEILECMSCETLVMVPGIGERGGFLHHGENCLCFSPESAAGQVMAICRAFDDKERRASIGRRAREAVIEQYGQKKILPEHAALLKKEYTLYKRTTEC